MGGGAKGIGIPLIPQKRVMNGPSRHGWLCSGLLPRLRSGLRQNGTHLSRKMSPDEWGARQRWKRLHVRVGYMDDSTQ
jgi:hypothetical protein